MNCGYERTDNIQTKSDAVAHRDRKTRLCLAMLTRYSEMQVRVICDVTGWGADG